MELTLYCLLLSNCVILRFLVSVYVKLFMIRLFLESLMYIQVCFYFVDVTLGTLADLHNSREKLEDLWSARKVKLELALQLRLFEREAIEVCQFLSLNLQ